MQRIILFVFVLVFSMFSSINNSLAKEVDNNIQDKISSEIEEVRPDNNKKIKTK